MNSVTWRRVIRRQYTRIVSRRTRNCLICDFQQLKRLSSQSKIAKIPVIVYPLGLYSSCLTIEIRKRLSPSSCSIFNLRSGLQHLSEVNGIEQSNFLGIYTAKNIIILSFVAHATNDNTMMDGVILRRSIH